MGQRYAEISPRLREFITAQKLFFVATAGHDGRVNVSPKGMDTLRLLDVKRAVWLNLTGSGNETAAHVLENPRMTLMVCAFEGRPIILRLYGQAKVFHPRDELWGELVGHFPPLPGARQVFEMTVELVQTSCGFGVPLFDYVGQRNDLADWAVRKGEGGISTYWRERNSESLDGKPTYILGENGLAEAEMR